MEVVSFNCWTRLLEADIVKTGKARPIDILQSRSFCIVSFDFKMGSNLYRVIWD